MQEQVSRKLQLAFTTPEEAFRYFDIARTGQVMREHMVVCLGTFSLDLNLHDCMRLFDFVDADQDEALDLKEFTQAFFREAHNPDQQAQLFSDEKALQRPQRLDEEKQGPKLPMEKDELLDYPYFFRLKMNNLNLNQRKNKFPKRALSIVPAAKTSNDNLGQLVRQKELLYSARHEV